MAYQKLCIASEREWESECSSTNVQCLQKEKHWIERTTRRKNRFFFSEKGLENFCTAKMANPRKFSEKIAMHNQRQAEETAEFERIMREVSDATSRVSNLKSKQ